ncbi:MAG TPA: hypothetical protein VFQ42_21970 [Mycobacterium sp.]|nr:hypothetical protein [Mycobacterium sp.]
MVSAQTARTATLDLLAWCDQMRIHGARQIQWAIVTGAATLDVYFDTATEMRGAVAALDASRPVETDFQGRRHLESVVAIGDTRARLHWISG